MTKVLVVEDDPAIRRGLVDALTFAGHEATGLADGLAALDALAVGPPDLLLLDVMLPGADGLAVLAGARQRWPRLPVIMVTARGSEEDRVAGLTLGADDYVVKPFSARELLARVAAVLRRAPDRADGQTRLCLGRWRVELDARRMVDDDGNEQPLSEREAELLDYLHSAAPRVVARDELLQHVWGLDPKGLSTRTVDMHVARLRAKLGDPGDDGSLIVTVRGSGYRLALTP